MRAAEIKDRFSKLRGIGATKITIGLSKNWKNIMKKLGGSKNG